MGLFDRVKLTRDVMPCFFCNMPVDHDYYYSIKLMRENDENLNNYDDKVEVSPEGRPCGRCDEPAGRQQGAHKAQEKGRQEPLTILQV